MRPLPLYISVLLLMVGLQAAWSVDFGQARSLELEVQPVTADSGMALQVSWPEMASMGEYRLQILPAAGEATTVVINAAQAVWDAARGENRLTFLDTAVSSGERKEYRMVAYPTAGGHAAYGHAAGGHALPLVEDRGGVILLVDQSQSAPLAFELARLESDLLGDGWTVYRQDVSPSETPPQLKAHIIITKAQYPSINTVFLFGDLAVPYSGRTAPDGHMTHYGAWPTDAYYGDLDEDWTDTSINVTSAARSETHNVPGDGKFDQSKVSTVELAVGRVDLADMPAFAPLTETDLLRRYLNKNHAFRHGQRTFSPRAIIDDNLSSLTEAVAGSARRSFPALVGRPQVEDVPWSQAAGRDYLFGFGAGNGTYTSANGIATTASYSQTPSQIAFAFLFGSYFGDFDNPDNFLRSMLASADGGLTVCWGARPYWGIYRTALGDTMGDVMCSVYNERSTSYYNAGLLQGGVQAALLGDPTLRAHPVSPSHSGTASPRNGQTTLQWQPSQDPEVIGYHIYKHTNTHTPLKRITDFPIAGTTYTAPGEGLYHVRAIKLEHTASGSYYNASQSTPLQTVANLSLPPIQAWRAEAFSNSSASQANAANPDGDELSNLMEYALGTSPTEPQHFPVSLDMNTGEFTFQENILATDATLICEMSANLVDWIPADYDHTIYENLPASVPGTQIRRVTLRLRNLPDDRCSFRLRVEVP